MNQEIKSLVSASNNFAFELYKQLKDADKNMFFSPISLSLALSMAYVGARENTAEEMKEALGFTLHRRRYVS